MWKLRLLGIVLLAWIFVGCAAHILDDVPLIDGHNDFPYNLYQLERNNLNQFDFTRNLTNDPKWGRAHCKSCYTDLPRLRKGKVGAQFWVAFVGCPTQYRDAVARTLEQIDIIKRLVRKYPQDLAFVTDADGIMKAFAQKKIASLIGIEGGHSIDSRTGVLRMMYELGARYMTLTHMCQTPWADSSLVDLSIPVHNLTQYGHDIVREMNRLGMMVDLSHVSHNVMNEAILASKAPVIFSHSSAWAIRNHHRNVHDDTLKMLKLNGGICMVNFYAGYVAYDPKNATIYDVAKHINHIVDVAGIDHVGIGGDYDGVDGMPKDLEDVSKYPHLFDLLMQTDLSRWTVENLAKLASGNLLRVFKQVEEVSKHMLDAEPMQNWISREDLDKVDERNLIRQCRTYMEKYKWKIGNL